MLENNYTNIGVVIMAAGKGTRLNCSDKPKVMLEIGGKPIISYIVEILKEIGFKKEQICLVVGFQKEQIVNYFGDSVSYAVQEPQKGTAHAAYVGIKSLPSHINQVLIFNGDDSAFYTKETIADFLSEHLKNKVTLSLVTLDSDNQDMGRIIRYESGKIEIIEKEDLTEEQKKVKETNTNTFCYDRAWYENMFPRMQPLKGLGEYGINTTMKMAADDGKPVSIYKLKNKEEWFGINTLRELELANQRKQLLLN